MDIRYLKIANDMALGHADTDSTEIVGMGEIEQNTMGFTQVIPLLKTPQVFPGNLIMGIMLEGKHKQFPRLLP